MSSKIAWAVAAMLAFVFDISAAFAHPHVWITVRSRVEFTPDGNVGAIIHDWVFDEIYSSFATQGLAPKGQLVTRDIFAPLARENAGSLADVGYYMTLKIDGKLMGIAPVTEYWMEERPDHLVAFHVRLDLKAPVPIHRFGSLLVADPEFYIDFEFDNPPNGIALDHAPPGCSDSLTHPKPLETDDKKKLDESFFHQSIAGLKLRLQDDESGDPCMPVRLRRLLLAATLVDSGAPGLARPFAGGGGYGGLTGWNPTPRFSNMFLHVLFYLISDPWRGHATARKGSLMRG